MFQRHLLRDSDVEPLADGVLTVLDKVGILCQNQEMLKALDAMGARVDREAERVTFPPTMTAEFVEHVGRATPARDDEGHRAFPRIGLPSVGGQVAQFYLDPASDERRSGSRDDFIALLKLGEVLHGESGVGHALLLTDVPPLLEPLEAAMLMAEYASRPGRAFAWNVRLVDYLVEMGEILGIERWFSYGANCFAHPLRLDRDVADKFVRRVREGDTCGLTAMPVAGMTTPATLAGFVTVSAAEHVAVWMAGRALNPDVRLGGSMWGGSIDMRTGWVSYCAFDAMLYACAAVEFLRRWTGIEVIVGGGEYCDARAPGLYAALEKAYKAMTVAAFTGRHPGVGSGMLEEGKVLSPVQLLIERDLAAGVQHFGRTVEASPELLGLDAILDVGHGIDLNHMATEHTLHHFRTSLWLPQLLDRSGYAGPEAERAILDKARSQVGDLLAAYRKPEVAPDKLARMRQVVDRARRELL